MNLPLLAGTVSTVLFAVSMLPMLVKAARTRDLASYSLGNLFMSNVANVIHSVYVFSLPVGPIWLLHSSYVVASALMLVWCLRYGTRPAGSATPDPADGADSTMEHSVSQQEALP
ncbi:hypothetical protein [Arthrobacter sp. CJ23]|uniref:hypothetical protein n=1 Tax=Arthrobacter sp. CJ23 TaxID=2972479 RepID=UPI00215CEA99|nr:hypothetical protein [Arthrobacter sp. CJ23]UVJ38258.1 hypothetical protein NVV90_13500 [Arthrobacter sp. CJ23]